jgi:hypothetical protein
MERDRHTSTLKGFTTDFRVERDEILFVGRYQRHKKVRMRGQRKGGRGGLCSAEAVIYISKCWNWERTGRNPISVCFKHTDNFTQVNIHKNFTSITRRRETLSFLQLKDTKPEVL